MKTETINELINVCRDNNLMALRLEVCQTGIIMHAQAIKGGKIDMQTTEYLDRMNNTSGDLFDKTIKRLVKANENQPE